MIKFARGNILNAEAEALVNTVNTVGFMGKGIALQFKQAFPENFKAYQRACERKEVQPGRMFVYETGELTYPRYIINFPTKRHWRGHSKLEDIETGLKALVEEIKVRKIQSIAIPPLGCGLGGLNWSVVKPLIEQALAEVPEVEVLLYKPAGAPEARDMRIGTQRPKLTEARALFIQLMHQYQRLSYRLALLEIQKLAYFLQESGQPLRLDYEKGHYGPYARNLNKVLEMLEGHYTQGYSGSQKPDVPIQLINGAAKEAEEFLGDYPEALSRLDRVGKLIEGFETPYGMELLATVHWVATKESDALRSAQDAHSRIRQWSTRKDRLFTEEHVKTAWDRLLEDQFIPASTL